MTEVDIYESMKHVGIVSESGYYKDIERAISHIKGFIHEHKLKALLLMSMRPGRLEFIIVQEDMVPSPDFNGYVSHWMNILDDETPENEELFLTWWSYPNLPSAPLYLEGWMVPLELQFKMLVEKTECVTIQPAMAGLAGDPKFLGKCSTIVIDDDIKRRFSSNLVKNLSRI